jgi:hypothetical protein
VCRSLVKAPSAGTAVVFHHHSSGPDGGRMKKSDREIMEILEAFDATGCAHSAGRLAGVDPKTVRLCVGSGYGSGGDGAVGAGEGH